MGVSTAQAKSNRRSRTAKLPNERVAFTGRLSSLSRDEARCLVEQHGGVVAPTVTRDTTLLVVGAQRLPLAKSGRLTRNLRRAYRLQQQGVQLAIVDEQQWLARLDDRSPNEQHYSLLQMAEIVGVSARRIRAWVQMGLLAPHQVRGSLIWFDYSQVSAARTLARLQSRHARPGRFRRSIQQLVRLMPHHASVLDRLVHLQFNGPLLWRDDHGALLDPSGQLYFDFQEDQQPSVPFVPAEDVVDHFEYACQAESQGQLTEAEAAYRRALRVHGDHPDLYFNLGNVLSGLRRYAEAAVCYRQALQLEPAYAEAWNNLGVALGEMNQLDQACQAFQEALRLDPTYADALYNLADALDLSQRSAEARRYWQTYLRYDRTSLWARYALLRVNQRE